MSSCVPNSDELKAQALAALFAGQALSAVARTFGVPVGTLKSWKSRAARDGVAVVATEKREQIGDRKAHLKRTRRAP